MAQPMTLIATPDPDNTGCPELVNFCDGTCREYGDGYHSSGFTYLTVKRWTMGPKRAGFRNAQLSVSVYRDATKNRKLGKPKVTVITDELRGDQLALSPARARMLAAHLLNAADAADPIPTGVLVVAASAVRLGDDLLTADGWQKVVGQMVFVDQTNVWTDDRDHDPETDGWFFQPGDPVKVRRTMYGGDAALQQSKPVAAHCTGCRTDRLIAGRRHTSAAGVQRVRGRCQTCGKKQNSIVVPL